MFKINIKQVKMVSLMVAVFVMLGVVGVSNKVYAATPASATSTIGIVDFSFLMSQHPDMAAAQATVKAGREQAEKDFNDKVATLGTDQEKRAYFNQVQQDLANKEQVIWGAIRDKVLAAVKTVADSKGLTIVVDRGTAILGGQDITVEVGKKITVQ